MSDPEVKRLLRRNLLLRLQHGLTAALERLSRTERRTRSAFARARDDWDGERDVWIEEKAWCPHLARRALAGVQPVLPGESWFPEAAAAGRRQAGQNEEEKAMVVRGSTPPQLIYTDDKTALQRMINGVCRHLATSRRRVERKRGRKVCGRGKAKGPRSAGGHYHDRSPYREPKAMGRIRSLQAFRATFPRNGQAAPGFASKPTPTTKLDKASRTRKRERRPWTQANYLVTLLTYSPARRRRFLGLRILSDEERALPAWERYRREAAEQQHALTYLEQRAARVRWGLAEAREFERRAPWERKRAEIAAAAAREDRGGRGPSVRYWRARFKGLAAPRPPGMGGGGAIPCEHSWRALEHLNKRVLAGLYEAML